MQAVIGDDALDRTQTDSEVSLAQLLGHDLGGGLRVQKQVAQDLADSLVGAAVIGFGAGFFGLEGEETSVLEGVEQLVIALAAEAVFLGDGGNVLLEALALQEHEEAASQGIGWSDGQRPDGAGELIGIGLEAKGRVHGGRLRGGGRCVY